MQMWLLWNAAVRSLVIAFRGTEQVKWKDIMTDLSFQPAPFNPERVLERSSSASLIRQEVCPPVHIAHWQQCIPVPGHLEEPYWQPCKSAGRTAMPAARLGHRVFTFDRNDTDSRPS